MKTSRSSILTITLLSFILFATTLTASAQTLTAGVSADEVFDYSYNVVWTSTDPSATPSFEYLELNNTQKVQLAITDVSGPIISVDCIKSFKNGSSNVESGTVNIDSGMVTVPFGYLIIGANLDKGQQVYPDGGHQVITDTVTRTYSSGQRETNVIISEKSDETTTIYYDKVKGIAVEYTYEMTESSGSNTITSVEEMVNTNSDVWVIPEFPLLAIPVILLASAATVILVSKKQRSSPIFSFS